MLSVFELEHHRTGFCPQPVLRIHNCLNLCQSIVPRRPDRLDRPDRPAWQSLEFSQVASFGSAEWSLRCKMSKIFQDAMQCQAPFGPWNLWEKLRAFSASFTRKSGVTKSPRAKKCKLSFCLRWQPYFLDGRFGTCTTGHEHGKLHCL